MPISHSANQLLKMKSKSQGQEVLLNRDILGTIAALPLKDKAGIDMDKVL